MSSFSEGSTGTKMSKTSTLPETIMEVEHGLLEDCFPLQTGGFPLP